MVGALSWGLINSKQPQLQVFQSPWQPLYRNCSVGHVCSHPAFPDNEYRQIILFQIKSSEGDSKTFNSFFIYLFFNNLLKIISPSSLKTIPAGSVWLSDKADVISVRNSMEKVKYGGENWAKLWHRITVLVARGNQFLWPQQSEKWKLIGC